MMLRDESGQTLMELIIGATLLLIVSAATMAVLHSAAKAERGQNAKSETLEDMRFTMQRVTKDLRQAVSVDQASTGARLQVTTPVGGTERLVVYEAVAGELRRSVDGGPAEPLVSGLQTTTPFCYDPPACTAAGPSTSLPALVQVRMSVDPRSFDGEPIEIVTDVHLRNA